LSPGAIRAARSNSRKTLLDASLADLDFHIHDRIDQIDFRIRHVDRHIRRGKTLFVPRDKNAFRRHFLQREYTALRPAQNHGSLARTSGVDFVAVRRFPFQLRLNRDLSLDDRFEPDRNRAWLKPINLHALRQLYLRFVREAQHALARALIADVDGRYEIESRQIVELVSTAGEHHVNRPRRIVADLE